MGELSFRFNDADNHFNEPLNLYERYIDPSKKELAIRFVRDPSGRHLQLFAGKPSKFDGSQITYSKDELSKMLGAEYNYGGSQASEKESEKASESSDVNSGHFIAVPGMLLNRMNSLKGLDDKERAEVIAYFRDQSQAYGDRDLRLALMDDQGIDKAIMFPASAHDIEFEFADDIEAMYANVRAFNRWIYEEIGYAYQGRMFLPPYIALADVDLALQELNLLLETGAPMIQIKSGHAHGGRANPFGGRSPADPVFDPIWARINEAGVKVSVHLGATDYQKYGADWSEDPEVTFGAFDAFQWMTYWGDKPAMELVSGLILHNFFGRFPNIRVCLAEQGTVWVPYTMRKMDHAFMMGRKTKFGDIEDRPSRIFRKHFVVAPYPEENVRRVVDEVGIDPIVFGSDFPHGEGLAWPKEYAANQLEGFTDDEIKAIMRDNFERYLTGATA